MLLSDGVSGTDNARPTLYVAGGRAASARTSCEQLLHRYEIYCPSYGFTGCAPLKPPENEGPARAIPRRHHTRNGPNYCPP
eukprot:901916-Prymnesium_polylepis.1